MMSKETAQKTKVKVRTLFNKNNHLLRLPQVMYLNVVT